MLKTIIASQDEHKIFKQTNSCRAIAEAQNQVDETHSLIDVLIETNANVRTIDYNVTVEQYNTTYAQSNKVKTVLNNLGKYRNCLTHFGIEISSKDEILCLFINTFDVIYNYLYPQLIVLDEIGEYFTEDGIFVKTIHGIKPLVDENDEYTNIVDFLDEVLGDGNDYLFKVCKANPKNQINVYDGFVDQAFQSQKLKYLEEEYNLQICRETASETEGLEFSICKGNIDYFVMLRYLPFYNAALYFDESGNILFFVLFNEKKIYLYNNDKTYPGYDEPDEDCQWESDLEQGLCIKLELSKNNIIKAFKTIIVRNKQLI